MKLTNIIKNIFLIVLIIFTLFISAFYLSTFHPKKIQSEKVFCENNTPVLSKNQKLKILSWNVQYMAGKNYVFFYDMPDNKGPDIRPSSKDIEITINEVARIINNENPDIILFQEIDKGSKRTDYEDQLKIILSLISKDYKCHTSTFYHKAFFIPHPDFMGSIGLKLAIISKYKINKAIRYQLPIMPNNFIVKQFYLKRAVLETYMPVNNGKDFIIMNTHLDAFDQGTDTMEKQVEFVDNLLTQRTQEKYSWLIGGDFNLLAPGKSYNRLQNDQKPHYKEKSELALLFKKYKSMPNLHEINGNDYKRWFTHNPNDPRVKFPDRTIDYMFMSNDIKLKKHYVRQKDTIKISDHFPLIAEIIIP